MRLIGHLAEEQAARNFSDFLLVEGIETRLEHEKGSGWAVWILDEEKIGRAADLLKEFQQNPGQPKFVSQGQTAANLRAEEQKANQAYRNRLRSRRHLFQPLTMYGFGPLTFALIVASIWVFVVSKYGRDLAAIPGLFITTSDSPGLEWSKRLPEITHGEIWRLLTPMFIHFSPLHILCNMLWLRDLGSMIEGRQSSLHLLELVVVVAAASNLGQFYFGGGAAFGGMSGVVYGLLGYVWLRGKFDPASGIFLHPTTVSMMLIWFFACWLNIIPNVANVAHAVGLVVGLAWGYISSLKYR